METTRDLILTQFEDYYYYTHIDVDLINVYQFSDFALLSCPFNGLTEGFKWKEHFMLDDSKMANLPRFYRLHGKKHQI